MSGFALKNVMNENTAMDESLDWLLKNALKKKNVSLELPQLRNFKDEKSMQIYSKSITCFLQFGMAKRRVCFENSFASLPFGYTKRMKTNLDPSFAFES